MEPFGYSTGLQLTGPNAIAQSKNRLRNIEQVAEIIKKSAKCGTCTLNSREIAEKIGVSGTTAKAYVDELIAQKRVQRVELKSGQSVIKVLGI
jgi:CTP-dependent riboflavin kinase